MALRNMRFIGDDILRKNCRTVEKFNVRLWELLDDLKETLDKEQGAGLAAPQVGILKRVAIVSFDDVHIELVNPEIVETEGEQDGPEGCLSVPNKSGYVKRPMKVKVHAQDRNGNWFDIEEQGFIARALCHEIDHLSGVMFVDKVHKWLEDEDMEEIKRRSEAMRKHRQLQLKEDNETIEE